MTDRSDLARAGALLALAALAMAATTASPPPDRIQANATSQAAQPPSGSEATPTTGAQPPLDRSAPAEGGNDGGTGVANTDRREAGYTQSDYGNLLADAEKTSTEADEAGWAQLAEEWVLNGLLVLIGGVAGVLIATIRMRRKRKLMAWEAIDATLSEISKRLDTIDRNTKAGRAPDESNTVRTTERNTELPRSEKAIGQTREMATPTMNLPRDSADAQLRMQMKRAIDSYAQLILTRGAKPRQFDELLSQFPRVYALDLDSGQALRATTFQVDDPGLFAVAVGNERDYVVLPTYEYLSNFRAFSRSIQNPEVMRKLFEFQVDGSGQLQVSAVGHVSIDEMGAVHVNRRGRLTGFSG